MRLGREGSHCRVPAGNHCGPLGANQLQTSGVDHAPPGYPRGGGGGDGGGKGAKDCVHLLPGVLIPALLAPAGGQSPQVKGRCRQLEFGLWEERWAGHRQQMPRP